MMKLKQILLALNLVSIAIVAPVSAMQENTEAHPVVSTYAQSVVNTLSAVKSIGQIGINLVSAEIKAIPGAINYILTSITSPEKAQNMVEPKSSGYSAHAMLFAIKDGIFEGARYYGHNAINYTHDAVNYTHNAVNTVLTNITTDEE